MNNTIGGDKQLALLESDKTHHFEYQCEKNQNLIEASSQIEFLSFEIKNQDSLVGSSSKRFIAFSSLSKQQMEDCGDSCLFHKIDCFFNDDHSFFFDYLPSSHIAFAKQNQFALMIETQFFCSERNKNSLDTVDQFLIKKEETQQVELQTLVEKYQSQEEENLKLKIRVKKLESLISKLLDSKKN